MTQDRMQLSELLEKAGADDIVREMIGFVAQRLMDLDVANRCGAAHKKPAEAGLSLCSCLFSLEARTGIEPMYTALQAV